MNKDPESELRLRPRAEGEWSWKCPYCGQDFALALVEEAESEKYGKLRTFRCKYCCNEVQFADKGV